MYRGLKGEPKEASRVLSTGMEQEKTAVFHSISGPDLKPICNY